MQVYPLCRVSPLSAHLHPRPSWERESTYRTLRAPRVSIPTTLSISSHRTSARRTRTITTTTWLSHLRRIPIRPTTSRLSTRRHRRRRAAHLTSRLTPRTPAPSLLRHTPRHHSRPRRHIAINRRMDIDLNPRITTLVRARELDGTITRTAPSTHRNLITRDIKLRTTALASGMQRQRFGAQQVIATGDVFGDGHVHAAAARVQVARAPVVVIPHAAAGLFGPRVGKDLEPVAGRTVGGGGVGHFGEINLYRTPVGATDGFGFAGAVAWLLFFLGGVRG